MRIILANNDWARFVLVENDLARLFFDVVNHFGEVPAVGISVASLITYERSQADQQNADEITLRHESLSV